METSPQLEAVDRNGNPVRVGTVVRVLSIPDSVFAELDEREAADLRTMGGAEFAIEEIDQWGSACVTKWWHLGNGEHNAHELMLAASEMEVVPGGAVMSNTSVKNAPFGRWTPQKRGAFYLGRYTSVKSVFS